MQSITDDKIQESETLEQYMQQCQMQLDKYADPANVPINVDLCGQVMGAVTDPFTQE
jgi:carboxypeptidase D